jgi:tetratricopeptide (TPR) repeat protein
MKSPRFFRIIFASFILIFAFGSLAAQESYYAPDKIRQFADYLYQEKDYLRAATEYQRYLFGISPGGNTDSITYRIALCYQKAGEYSKAISELRAIYHKIPSSGLNDNAGFQIALAYYESGLYDSSLQFINTIDYDRSAFRTQLNNLAILNYFNQKRWQNAFDFSEKMVSNKSNPPDSSQIVLNALATRGIRLPHKSKIVAAGLSAIVPGSGKLYAGRFSDGIYSFVLIGLSGWQAYEGFHKDKANSTRGWIYGTLGTIFYAGNIYGSAAAVKVYNNKVENDFLAGIDFDIFIK